MMGGAAVLFGSGIAGGGSAVSSPSTAEPGTLPETVEEFDSEPRWAALEAEPFCVQSQFRFEPQFQHEP